MLQVDTLSLVSFRRGPSDSPDMQAKPSKGPLTACLDGFGFQTGLKIAQKQTETDEEARPQKKTTGAGGLREMPVSSPRIDGSLVVLGIRAPLRRALSADLTHRYPRK